MIVYSAHLPDIEVKSKNKPVKHYWDFIQDAVDDGIIESMDNHIPIITNYSDRVVGPIYDYEEWVNTYKEHNPKTLYRIITRNKKDNQYRLFNYNPKIKYLLLIERTDFIYGMWDCETHEGYIYPSGKDLEVD